MMAECLINTMNRRDKHMSHLVLKTDVIKSTLFKPLMANYRGIALYGVVIVFFRHPAPISTGILGSDVGRYMCSL
jgi:hypothetical protein